MRGSSKGWRRLPSIIPRWCRKPFCSEEVGGAVGSWTVCWPWARLGSLLGSRLRSLLRSLLGSSVRSGTRWGAGSLGWRKPRWAFSLCVSVLISAFPGYLPLKKVSFAAPAWHSILLTEFLTEFLTDALFLTDAFCEGEAHAEQSKSAVSVPSGVATISPRLDQNHSSQASQVGITQQDGITQQVAITLQLGMSCHRVGSAPTELSHIFAADTGQIISVAKSGDVCSWRGLKSQYLGSIPENFSAVALDPVSNRLAIAVGQQVSIMTQQDSSTTVDPTTVNQSTVIPPSVPPLSVGSPDQRLKTVSEINRVGTGISALDFHPDGESLLLGGLDGKIYRWRLSGAEHGLLQTERTENLERYFGHSAVISALAMHSFGKIFLSGDWNGVLSIWALYDSDVAKGEFDSDLMPGKYFSESADRIKVDRALSDEIIAIKLSLDGEIFALATAAGDIEVWKVRGVKKLASVKAHKGDIFAFDLDRSGRRLVSLGRDGSLKMWELESLEGRTRSVSDDESGLSAQTGEAQNGDAQTAGRAGESPSFVLKLTSVNHDRGFSAAAFDVSGKVVVGKRDGQLLRQN